MGKKFVTEFRTPEHHLSIQVMSVEDLDPALALERSAFLTPWSRESFLNAIQNPNGINLVCKHKKEVVGYMTSFMVMDELYITNLLVAIDYQRQGIATELLKSVIRIVRIKKGVHLFLEVRENNSAAINFYKKLKFQLVGVRKRYYSDSKEDALVMKLTLNKE